MPKTRNNIILLLLVLLVILPLIGLVLFHYLQKPRILIVPDKYKSISSAMNSAEPGDTIFVKAGVYREPNRIIFKNAVQLIGETTDKVSIQIEDEKASCIILVKDCNNALIQGITVESVSTLAGKSRQKGIQVKDSSVVINECQIRNMPGDGLFVTSKSDLSLKKSIIESNSGDGANIWGLKTLAVIEQTVFVKNVGQGVRFFLGSGGSITKSLFEGNNDNGILVLNKCGPVTVRECACITNGQNGIYFGETKGQIKNNYLAGNLKLGIYVNGAPDTTVSGNRCISNASYGICFDSGATGIAEKNICENNIESGIYATGLKTDVKISANSCRQNIGHGITFYQCVRGTIESNICEGNGRAGIYMCETGKGVAVVDNWCRENEKDGIYFLRVTDTVSKGNISSSNKQTGIRFAEKSSAVAENNNCYSNRWSGICVMGVGATAILTNNECFENYPSGILFSHSAVGTAKNNLCQNNPWSGIAARGLGTKPTLISNTCKSNGAWGIVTWAGAEPSIANDNTILGNGRGGIKLHHQADFGLYGMLIP